MMTMEQAEKAIKNAWIAGIVVGVGTLLFCLKVGPWGLLDVFAALGLTFGIYKKSRACTVIMFVYFVGSRILLLPYYLATLDKSTLTLLVVLTIFFASVFFKGIQGTFAYRKIAESEKTIDVGVRPA